MRYHTYMRIHVYDSNAHMYIYMHEHMNRCVITFSMAQG